MYPLIPFAFRFQRGADLKDAIESVVVEHGIRAGSIASCVGSLSCLRIRLAGAQKYLTLEEPLEIVSIMGTLTHSHQHIHISVANRKGEVFGGHLMPGSIIDTTAELIIHSYNTMVFTREFDMSTGFTELVIRNGI
ncbi:DNA-binding protein [Vibrio sp. S9_S30]|uniref:PPC domain-containing DNA-binding protein n=1 Tax=Vibrio sp. S9_S30 TaxID=2720226 RepID=UPI00168049AF|nr:PPC domain-containing DNA-binding protein [Vibrio sp. S9_S30]MBD1559743.1 DNA-binding protein [Vibrio sp. S9_S30]